MKYFSGKHRAGLRASGTQARRNNPFGKYDWILGSGPYYMAHHYEDAINVMRQAIQNPASYDAFLDGSQLCAGR